MKRSKKAAAHGVKISDLNQFAEMARMFQRMEEKVDRKRARKRAKFFENVAARTEKEISKAQAKLDTQQDKASSKRQKLD